ncbi:MAG: flavodoxin family protein [Proteobacteria bacterium]|nr:MAG: flavodoxin family protein [Pseudomonadota bacterium]
MSAANDVRRSGKEIKLSQEEFYERFNQRYEDPAYDKMRPQIQELAAIAYKAYHEGRKAPKTVKAGLGFEDPDYDLNVEWVKASQAIKQADLRRKSAKRPRVLIINGSDRNDQTCPGEISKSSRLIALAKDEMEKSSSGEIDIDVLELNTMTSEYGKTIYPCKGCVSTAMPLCHWPCSCYPHNSLGQVNDWMNEIYPRWVEADGIMIVTPVYWRQAPSTLKLMIDRMVCADGGNEDPTSTQGKTPELAKKLEIKGWDYPRHLKGRVYSIVVHGDTEGIDDLKTMLSSWLDAMELIPAGTMPTLARFIGYYEDYATSHRALDKDEAIQKEVRNSAKALYKTLVELREGGLKSDQQDLDDPRPK